MRFTASVALLAAAVAARPQDQPISQISDGQIQAPPATPEVPAATTGVVVPTELPGTESVVVPPVATSGEVAPSVPAGAETTAVPGVPTNTPPVPGVTSTPVVVVPGGNTTVPSGTSSPSGTSGSGSESSGTPSGTGASSEGTGAASVNMASFGGLAVAIAGFLLA